MLRCAARPDAYGMRPCHADAGEDVWKLPVCRFAGLQWAYTHMGVCVTVLLLLLHCCTSPPAAHHHLCHRCPHNERHNPHMVQLFKHVVVRPDYNRGKKGGKNDEGDGCTQHNTPQWQQ